MNSQGSKAKVESERTQEVFCFLKLVILEPDTRLLSVSIWQAEVELLAQHWDRLPT